MKYFTPKEIKSTPKIWKFINFDIFMMLIVILGISMMFENLVYEPFVPFYYVFTVLTGLILFLPSKDNPKRRLYQSMLITLKKEQNEMFFKPEKNISRKRVLDES